MKAYKGEDVVFYWF